MAEKDPKVDMGAQVDYNENKKGSGTMSTGYLRLKVGELLQQHDTNLHRAMYAGGFNYTTMWNYWKKADEVESMHVRSIVGLLVDALGYTPEQVEDLRFGDVFEVVIDGGKAPAEDSRGRPPRELT